MGNVHYPLNTNSMNTEKKIGTIYLFQLQSQDIHEGNYLGQWGAITHWEPLPFLAFPSCPRFVPAEEILAAESIVPWNAHITELEYGEHVHSVLAQLKTAAEERLNQLAQPALSPP